MKASSSALISIRDLSLCLASEDGRKVRQVLDGVSLELQAGELVCVIGPSGCGKSTLLNVVAGFQPFVEGEVLIHGRPVEGPDPRRIYVFQNSGVFPWLTVAENVGFAARPRAGDADRAACVRRHVSLVGLSGFESSYPRQLSGGMLQRVELARALAADPEILFMDEPFSALDYLGRLRLREDLLRIWAEDRKTILFVTHDIDEAITLADRVVVMEPRPTSVRTTIRVAAPRPRDLASSRCLEVRDQIFAAMGLPQEGSRQALPARSLQSTDRKAVTCESP